MGGDETRVAERSGRKRLRAGREQEPAVVAQRVPRSPSVRRATCAGRGLSWGFDLAVQALGSRISLLRAGYFALVGRHVLDPHAEVGAKGLEDALRFFGADIVVFVALVLRDLRFAHLQ